jgi:hypothetical protein
LSTTLKYVKAVATSGLVLSSILILNAAGATESQHKADALLQIDLNRGAVIEKIATAWALELPADRANSFRGKLNAMRADQILAASLSGTLDGVLEIINAHETGSHIPASTLATLRKGATASVSPASLNGENAKALGDLGKDLTYTPITPCTIVDTRNAGGSVAAGASRAFDAVNVGGDFVAQGGTALSDCAIPAGAKAIAAGISIFGTSNSGYVTLYAQNTPLPFSVTALFNNSANVPNNDTFAVIPLCTIGCIDDKEFNYYTAGSASQVLINVTGYFLPVTRGNIAANVAGGDVFRVTNTNASSGSVAIRGVSTSTGSGGIGVYGSHAGGGYGVYGEAQANGYGVIGYAPVGTNSSAVFANGDLTVAANGKLAFGVDTRQMIDLLDTTYGIGVQNSTLYYRTGSNHVWHLGGSHANGEGDPGAGGSVMMTLRPTANAATVANGHLYAILHNTSDRASKQSFSKVNPLKILERVVSLPISTWAYKSDAGTRHIGPTAQDFKATFGLGGGGKSIATVDADGIALAAIQGLHQKLIAEINTMRHQNGTLQKELDTIKKKLGL